MSIDYLLNKHRGQDVILIDLSWVLYRSYYAFKDLTNQQGEPTGQYYGLTNQLKQIIKSYPDSLILLVDDGHPIERKELDESYKGNREHSVHFTDKKHIVDCIIQYLPNVYRVYNPVVEADDLLFSISRKNQYESTFIIYTTDKDLYQALTPTVFLASEFKQGDFIKKHTYSDQYINYFEDLEPYQLPFYRAVLGDPSDNLKIIRPRFPSKVAYYFAKNYIKTDGYEVNIIKPSQKPDDLTDRQYECLLEIYSSETYMKNLKLMRLSYIESIPIIDKVKQSSEVTDILNSLELHQYIKWLKEYLCITI